MDIGTILGHIICPESDWSPITLKRVIAVMHLGIGDA